MTTGANFEAQNGRILWWQSLISGDKLLTQDHESRVMSRQETYRPYSEYGNPFVDTISSEISKTERDMRLISEMKECSLQDGRFVDCIVDEDSILEEENTLTFKYELIKANGGIIEFDFPLSGQIEEPVDPEVPEILYYNFISEDGDNFISEDSENFITEWAL